jgi:hypothetical protein
MIKRPTWILLSILVVVLIGAWLIQASPFGKKVEPTPTTSLGSLFKLEANPIIACKITDNTGKTVAIARDANGNWILTDPAGLEADTDRIQTAINRAQSMSIIMQFDPAPDLTVIGLNPPVYQIQATFADGTQQTAMIGNLTTTGSGYYGQLEGGPVLLINQYGTDGLLDLIKNIPIKPTPTVDLTQTVITPTLTTVITPTITATIQP